MKKANSSSLIKTNEYVKLVDSIGALLESARKDTIRTINNILVKTYWELGKVL
jgi:hypothetical protein